MSKDKGSATTLKVLFIGNSFTARNDVPGLIGQLAAERGLTLEHRLISAGGASLKQHWNAGEAKSAIETGGYDYVVLQEQSTLPVKNAARFHDNVRLFDDAIKRSGAKMGLYMTWARQHARDSQQALTNGYTEIGRELGALVIPVGIAWEAVRQQEGDGLLYDKDGSHPSPAGSYLAACVFVATLFGENPVGLSCPFKISETEIGALQKIAWQTVAATKLK